MDGKLEKTLRRKLKACKMTNLEIYKATDINPATLSRYMNGQTTIGADKADVLLGFFGLEVAEKKPRKKKTK